MLQICQALMPLAIRLDCHSSDTRISRWLLGLVRTFVCPLVLHVFACWFVIWIEWALVFDPLLDSVFTPLRWFSNAVLVTMIK
jgi:hypothetical protein